MAVWERQHLRLNELLAALCNCNGFWYAQTVAGLSFAVIPDDVGAAFPRKNEVFPTVVVEVRDAYL